MHKQLAFFANIDDCHKLRYWECLNNSGTGDRPLMFDHEDD